VKQTSVLFVCLGNICRSPMAEAVFRHLVGQRSLSEMFSIDSAGLIGFHEGELPDSRMRSHAFRRGYSLTHRSRPVKKEDFDRFDLVIGMDNENVNGLRRLAASDEYRSKIHKMTEFSRRVEADVVPDPYYGGDKGFELVIDLLEDACEGLFDHLAGSGKSG